MEIVKLLPWQAIAFEALAQQLGVDTEVDWDTLRPMEQAYILECHVPAVQWKIYHNRMAHLKYVELGKAIEEYAVNPGHKPLSKIFDYAIELEMSLTRLRALMPFVSIDTPAAPVPKWEMMAFHNLLDYMPQPYIFPE